MMMALILALCLALLFFLGIALFPLGAATNEKTRSQTAADAAALGGAEVARMRWLDLTTRPGVLEYPAIPLPPVPETGAAAAATFAEANDARLTRYAVSAASGRVYAQVENTYAYDSSRGYATSDATVAMAIDFGSCRWTEPEPPGTLLAGGPATFDRTISCGAWSASYIVENGSPPLQTVGYAGGDTRQQLLDDLEPRLVE